MAGPPRRTPEPPGPPLPPSGPPSGLNFSRCTDATPLPPRPAMTCNVTRSTNVGTAMGSLLWASRVLLRCFSGQRRRALPMLSGTPSRWIRIRLRSSLPRRNDVDDATAPLGAELHVARDQREQGVVLATADAAAGVEVSAALAHDDLAGVDELTAVALHAEALGVGVATVLGRRCSLFVSHELSLR